MTGWLGGWVAGGDAVQPNGGESVVGTSSEAWERAARVAQWMRSLTPTVLPLQQPHTQGCLVRRLSPPAEPGRPCTHTHTHMSIAGWSYATRRQTTPLLRLVSVAGCV